MTKLPLCLLVLLSGLGLATHALAADTDIRLSSVGYLPLRAKRASVVVAGTTFTVVRDADGTVVLSGALSAPVNDPDTGESVSTADFTPLADPGTYHLEVDGVGRSVSFPIDPDVYRSAFVTSMLGFYGWRCGTAVSFDYAGTHFGYPSCHAADAHSEPIGGTGLRDGTGGWHDAGDYGKYTVNAALSAGVLLAAWEDYGTTLASVALQIPETGGALPDYLAEIKWELTWLLKMQYGAADGRVSHKLTEASHPAFIMPDADTGARSFVPYGTAATADFVAVLAKAARIYRPYDLAFSDQCLAAARVSYDYLVANPTNVAANETGFIGSQYASSDDDDRVWAAAEMWASTGDGAALADFETRVTPTATQVSSDFDWSNLRNLGIYSYLSSSLAGRSDTLVSTLKQAVVQAADALVSTHDKYGYGRALSSYYWGVNGSLGRTCMLLGLAYRVAPQAAYIDTCSDQLSYLFGRNPYDRSFVTGIGQNPPLHIHHRPSAADGIAAPYPGLLVGGSWVYREIAGPPVIPACTLPAAQCWVDDQGNYEVNEVAINWNAALVYALASFVGGGAQAPSGSGNAGSGNAGSGNAGSGNAGTPGAAGLDGSGAAGQGTNSHHSSSSTGGCGCSAADSRSGRVWSALGFGVAVFILTRRARIRPARSQKKSRGV